MPNDKHLVEFYEHYGENDDKDIYNGKLMLRGYIKTSPPEKTRKKPALSAIFGVIILIAIAASGVAVFSTTLQQFDTRDDDFIDFIGADVWLLGNGIYLDLTIQTSGTGEILIGGDLSPDVTCTPSNDHEKYTCNNTAPDHDVNVKDTIRGIEMKYTGSFTAPANIGNYITIEVTANNGEQNEITAYESVQVTYP